MAGHETRDFTQVLRDLFQREHASRCLIQGCYYGDGDQCVYCAQPKPAGTPEAKDGRIETPEPPIAATAMPFPPHKCALTLDHNPHRVAYQTVERWLEEAGDGGPGPTWPSPEERQRAVDINEIWVLTWYPNTAIGFQWVAATTLEGVLRCAKAEEA